MGDTHFSGVDTDSLKIGGTAVAATADELNYRILTAQLTLGTAGTVYVVSPVAGDVIAVYTAIDQALSTGDETLTLKDKDGNSMGTIVITQSGSAAGDVDSNTSLSNDVLAAGDTIEIETDGNNGTAAICVVTLLIEIT